jgi:hypothetical protein
VSGYDQRFYAALKDIVKRSASVIVPLVVGDLTPKGVVDFGCGEGDWLASFGAHGATELLGYDGDHLSSRTLAIPPTNFRAMDLEAAKSTPHRFDLALCLEGEGISAPREGVGSFKRCVRVPTWCSSRQPCLDKAVLITSTSNGLSTGFASLRTIPTCCMISTGRGSRSMRR